MLDKVAAIQHEIWSHWIKYLFEVSVPNKDGSVTIPAQKVERWKRQMETAYEDLSEKEKQSDIEQALKVIGILSQG